ncbi:restriction endonuclease subunit S [Limosilactobacillus mucosae]|uniref:restriction endonuclease subunit S n=1 Tax=Limosilactobacillus mucosae TaxID=97478 RepID=UPI0025A37694|nr:restriction endonuclease subunit S [Limosilactobacillus mucosae]MDM8220781.1 restriction endonuclease subunit S [Limosilactobacillus mucosae]
MGEIATIVGGGTPSTKNSEYWDGDINWYSPAEIGNQIYAKKSERQITELGLKKSSAKLLPVGTVLFTSRAGIGKTAILNKEACTNQGFQSIIPRSKMLNSYFLFSRTNSLKQYGETMGSGSTFVEVSGKQMSKMPLFIPNINEQSKIAKLFQSLDRTITLHEEKQCQLEQLKKALLQKMFADETGYPVLRFKGFTEKWEQRKLGEIANIVRGASPRPIKNPKWFDESSDIGWLRISDVTEQDGRVYHLNQHISKLGETKTRVLTEPHVLLSIAATVGKPLINYCKTGVHDGFLIFQKPHFNLEFMFQWLTSFEDKWKKYSQPGSQVNLNSDIVKNQNIAIPSIEEQEKIGQLFQSLDRTITLHDKKIQYLKQLKRGLLQKMFV